MCVCVCIVFVCLCVSVWWKLPSISTFCFDVSFDSCFYRELMMYLISLPINITCIIIIGLMIYNY